MSLYIRVNMAFSAVAIKATTLFAVTLLSGVGTGNGQPAAVGNVTVIPGDMTAAVSFTSFDASAVSFEGGHNASASVVTAFCAPKQI